MLFILVLITKRGDFISERYNLKENRPLWGGFNLRAKSF